MRGEYVYLLLSEPTCISSFLDRSLPQFPLALVTSLILLRNPNRLQAAKSGHLGEAF